jgi:hypothetical protein
LPPRRVNRIVTIVNSPWACLAANCNDNQGLRATIGLPKRSDS